MAMKNLYLDSNIWLSLYHYSKDDLQQFRKLNDLINQEITLYVPQQTYDEVRRNRDTKLKEALETFEKFNLSFPTFCQNYDEYSDFNDEYKLLKEKHTKWCEKIREDITKESLPADQVINLIFDNIRIIPCKDSTVQQAETRYKRGNPPGKDNKYGDAVNWECLLKEVPKGEDLYFISADNDYSSSLDKQSFNYFLKKEWKDKKNSEIHFYKNLVAFLNEHFKDIKMQNDSLKSDIMMTLINSRSFESTHKAIAQLSSFSDFTEDQMNEMYKCALNNQQVGWILLDEDVFEFYKTLLNKYNGSQEAQLLQQEIDNRLSKKP